MLHNRIALALFGAALTFSSSVSFAAASLTPADWKIIQEGLLEDDGSAYYLDIYNTYELTAVTLVAGDPEQLLIGYDRGEQWTFNKLPKGDHIPAECWNPKSNVWVAEDGDSRAKVTVEGNIMHTEYTGTGVPIDMRVTAYNTRDKAWQKLVAKWPQSLQLSAVTWPDKVYRVEMSQAQDVLCRDQDPNLYPLPKGINAFAQFDSPTIVQILFEDFFPRNFSFSGNRFSLGDGLAYQWEIITLSDGVQLLELMQEDAMEMEEEMEQVPEYYLLQNGQLFAVELYSKFNYEDQTNNTRLTFTGKFGETLRQHFKRL